MISDDAARQESNDTESIDDILGDERVEDLTLVGQLLPCLDRIAPFKEHASRTARFAGGRSSP